MQNLALNGPTPRHFPITVEIYHLMADKGAFASDDRVELIGGEIFDMSPVGSLHVRCVNFLNAYFSRLGQQFVVSVQNPIVLDSESEPQPDIALLRPVPDLYKDELPRAKDVILIVEVADSSVEFDRGLKFNRYASAGISEAWLIDLAHDRVEVHSRPKENGFGLVKVYTRGENAVSETMPEIDLAVDDILG